MDIFGSGIAGVPATGIGAVLVSASVTVAVALMAVWVRGGALAKVPVMRIVALIAGQLSLRSLQAHLAVARSAG